jgi:hypothetical protein
MEITTLIVKTAAGAPAAELVLRAGANVVVRVHEAPPQGGKGVISLAGLLVQARLPANLTPGQTLAVKVVAASDDQVVLEVQSDQDAHPATQTTHAVGALAVSGDPDLVRVATALAPPDLALPLPNGDALTLRVDSDDDAAEERRDGEPRGGEAAFILHSSALGPIEVRLRLDGGRIAATVAVDQAALPQAQAAAPELARALERATGGPAQVSLAGRAPDERRPPAPHVAEGLDAYA